MRYRLFGFELSINADAFDNHISRSLSEMEGYFADRAAFRELRNSGNPVVYEVYEVKRPETAGELPHGLSIVHAGAVGGEYFMTKGHYHSVRDTAEIYYCLAGRGLLLMENEDGEWAAEELCPGLVVYVPPSWAHRSINTSEKEDLVTFFAYPGHAGHDYGTIAQKGFRKRVVSRNCHPEIVDNAAWSESVMAE